MRLSTLYFLARDGYLLREIAAYLCKVYGIPIECRYLYCSRASLRMPSYHLIGEEALDLLLLGGYQVTWKSLMERAQLSETQRLSVYQDCGVFSDEESCLLSGAELDDVRRRLRGSALYWSFVEERSKMAFGNTIGYLRQEGLLTSETVAIVDSGWTGSMQRSLGQLLRAAGFTGRLVGFYFGMYAKPKSEADGTYLTWHFNAEGKIWDKIPFCNNLFECLLSAPHGMTKGYTCEAGSYRPLLLPVAAQERDKVCHHVNAVMGFVRRTVHSDSLPSFDEKGARQRTRQLISRFMAKPNQEEAVWLGNFLFCDDLTEGYHQKLADAEQLELLRGYSIPARIRRRFLRYRRGRAVPELYWPCGTIAFLPKWKRGWYRWNVYIWEWIRFVTRRA